MSKEVMKNEAGAVKGRSAGSYARMGLWAALMMGGAFLPFAVGADHGLAGQQDNLETQGNFIMFAIQFFGLIMGLALMFIGGWAFYKEYSDRQSGGQGNLMKSAAAFLVGGLFVGGSVWLEIMTGTIFGGEADEEATGRIDESGW